MLAAPLVADGGLIYREDLHHGLENAPNALAAILSGRILASCWCGSAPIRSVPAARDGPRHYCHDHSMALPLQTDHALVLFSGGQNSATCLIWALHRYARVETVGFRYGQRHAIELACREPIRAALASPRLGPDHIVDLTVTIAALGETALTSEATIAMTDEGLPNTFVPGRNLLFLTCAAAIAFPPRVAPDRRRDVRDRLFRLPRLPRRYGQSDATGA